MQTWQSKFHPQFDSCTVVDNACTVTKKLKNKEINSLGLLEEVSLFWGSGETTSNTISPRPRVAPAQSTLSLGYNLSMSD